MGAAHRSHSHRALFDMRKLLVVSLLFVMFSAALKGASETATVTVPNAAAQQLSAILETFIQGQRNPDGSLKYPGATIRARRSSLLDSILRTGLRDKVRAACEHFENDCPSLIKGRMRDQVNARDALTNEIDTLIQ